MVYSNDAGKRRITLEEQNDKQKERIINDLSKNERIKEILNIFPGAKIEEVKDKGKKMNNFNDMMKKAQEMQKKMQEMQESLSNLEVEGTSGGGIVKIIMNCKNEVKKIDIDPSIIKNDEKEVMEDLISSCIK